MTAGAVDLLDRLRGVLDAHPRRVIACSGGVDSLLLAAVASDLDLDGTVVAHAITPAVPSAATARVVDGARRRGWHLELVRSGEFDDERYLSNPVDRCYFCKSNLYDALDLLRSGAAGSGVLCSGTNVDDLGEFRPGLQAAAEREVLHPFVESRMTKDDVRTLARHLGLDWAELPASPCLASRLYTGTRVEPGLLRAVEVGEALVRRVTGIQVVRCRVDGREVRVEVGDGDRHRVDDALLADLATTMRAVAPTLTSVTLDQHAYRPGRAFLPVALAGQEPR